MPLPPPPLLNIDASESRRLLGPTRIKGAIDDADEVWLAKRLSERVPLGHPEATCEATAPFSALSEEPSPARRDELFVLRVRLMSERKLSEWNKRGRKSFFFGPFEERDAPDAVGSMRTVSMAELRREAMDVFGVTAPGEFGAVREEAALASGSRASEEWTDEVDEEGMSDGWGRGAGRSAEERRSLFCLDEDAEDELPRLSLGAMENRGADEDDAEEEEEDAEDDVDVDDNEEEEEEEVKEGCKVEAASCICVNIPTFTSDGTVICICGEICVVDEKERG